MSKLWILRKRRGHHRAPRRLLHQRECGQPVWGAAGVSICRVAAARARDGAPKGGEGREGRRCGSWRQGRTAGIWPGTFWDGCGNTVQDYSTAWSIGLSNPRKHGKNGNSESWLSLAIKSVGWESWPSLAGKAFPDARVFAPVGLRGIVFSNELLDAMPVHRLGWDAKARAWFEWGVTCQAGRFVWTRIKDGGTGGGDQQSNASLSISHLQMPIQSGLLEVLPDGFTTELSPAADQWWREAALALECGKLMTIDYGLTRGGIPYARKEGGHLARVPPSSVSRRRVGESGTAGHHGTREFHRHSCRGRISRIEDKRLPDPGAIPDRHCRADLERRRLVWEVDSRAHPPVSNPNPSGAFGTVVPSAGARAAFALGVPKALQVNGGR